MNIVPIQYKTLDLFGDLVELVRLRMSKKKLEFIVDIDSKLPTKFALTGNTVSGARKMYQEQGFDGFVKKPIQGRFLEREILNVLPPDVIEYRSETEMVPAAGNRIQEISRNKRKKQVPQPQTV